METAKTNRNHQTIIEKMTRAEIVDCQLVPWGSNYTFATVLQDPEIDGEEIIGIYKPSAGEIPLWDFPDDTLYRRERAAYLVSEALGWEIVPPTIIREGPHGIGSMQQYIEPEQEQHYFAIREERRDELRRMAVFDIITNNADRKASHCIVGVEDKKLWGIDHGLTFNYVPKLRTVIWDFQMEAIDECHLEDLRAIVKDEALHLALTELLDPEEVQAFWQRIELLLQSGTYPPISSRRDVPWGW